MSDPAEKTEASRGHDDKSSTMPPPPAVEVAPKGQRRFLQDVGDIIDGKYRIEAIIGRGGMGVVVAAQHLQLKETVALKFLLAQAEDEDEFRSRFLREAQVSAKLRGEHVARLMDFGAPAGAPPFMVMEYLQGFDIRQTIKDHGPLPYEAALDYIVQACEGLAEAHALGVVHRDLKPSNLFLTKRLDGSDLVKILDFGVSKMAGVGEIDDELTTAGAVLGSPRYMSPEQLRNSGDVDARADVWSLGAICYEMFVGRPPFQAPSTAALCARILGSDPIPSIAAVREDVPPAVEQAIFRCLERERDRRTPDVSGFVADLALATNLPWIQAAVGRIAAVLERRSTRADGVTGSHPGFNSTGGRLLGPGSSASSAMAVASGTGETSRSQSAAVVPPAKRPFAPIAIAVVLLLLGGALLLTRTTGGTAPAAVTPPPASASAAPVASTTTAPVETRVAPPPSTLASAPPVATQAEPPPAHGGGGRGKRGAPPPTAGQPPPPPPTQPTQPPRGNPLDDRFLKTMRLSRTLRLATVSSVLLAAFGAAAQPSPDDRAAAEGLFRDGRRLMDEGKIADGCRKLEESQRLDPAPGTLLNLAVCHEREGKLATAWADFNQALAQARKDARADRETLARERIAAIEPLLPHLVLDVPPASRVPGLKVSRNGSPLNEGAWGTPIPIDPGNALIEAEAPGHKRWSTTVALAQKGEARVSVPLLEELPPEAAASASAPIAPPPPTWTPRKIGGATLAGAGVVSLGVGAIMGLRALSKKSDSDAQCPPTADGKVHCTTAGATANDDAKTAARVADVTLGLGVVLIGAGTYFYFSGGVGESASTQARRIPIDFAVDSHGARASFGGAW